MIVMMWLSCLMPVVLGLLAPAHGTDYEPSEVCFDHLGCFSDSIPWAGTVERPDPRLPWSPEQIGTRFLLFTQQNPEYYQEISASKDLLHASNYDAGRKTRFIIHGYLTSAEENWHTDMCMLIVKAEDVNCISVDWPTWKEAEYSQAANNIRVVGAQVAYMMSFMRDSFNQSPADMHVIGHSLGAHAAAEAGRRTKGLARITGLDPSEPYFENCAALVRLDPTDATFVDVIHSNGAPFTPTLGFGMSQSVGHVDFYPNGGEDMIGCSKNSVSETVTPNDIWQGTRGYVACSHQRAYKYYSDTILNRSGFTGYPCNDYHMFQEGICTSCDGECPVMGHFADNFTIPEGVSKMRYYLETADKSPFARYDYHVNVTIDGAMTNPAYFKVALYGESTNTIQYRIYIGTVTPGKSYANDIKTKVDVGEITHVKFVWDDYHVNPLAKFGASRIEVTRFRDNKMFVFCGDEKLYENQLQTLQPCPAQ
ncbi:pancreatic triacylglycerol lipase-like [Engraulis encrasicolus]|uniref:pancreatic triacylglycerol lipase-like n=2 Tax=Engraulis encrasicolus TaxID=184585 RepID=UPI002FD53249